MRGGGGIAAGDRITGTGAALPGVFLTPRLGVCHSSKATSYRDSIPETACNTGEQPE